MAHGADSSYTEGISMTVAALVALIGLQCGINPYNANTSRVQKEICMERIINCAVGLDGVIKPTAAKDCTKKENI